MSSAVSDEISYMHRYDECMRREKVYGQKWLKLIYGSPLGALPLWAAIKRAWFSNWYGRKMNRPESQEKISGFIQEFDLDESEFASPANTFASFNEFFHENSKQGQDPFATNPKLLHFLPTEDIWGSRIWLKLHPFSSRAKDLTWPAFFNQRIGQAL